VRNRESLIIPEIKNQLYKYITGIVTNQKQKLLVINGMPDHVHILINCKPSIKLSDLVKEIKEHSTKFINAQKIIKGTFYWQNGFGAFSISKKEIGGLIAYINNQEEHHQTNTFKKEYHDFLEKNGIEYKEECLFDFELSDN
jgi:REP element-mobilizing transposase RayT